MCGIAGIIYKNNQVVSENEIKQMTDSLAHRGPDAEGSFLENNIGLGHRRLAIIDLSDAGRQPMLSSDGRFVITFNGEIYNYIELREELHRSGITFSTETDTEVIIESYRFWGENCFNRFNGMWAFCLYDKENKKVILCRDRFGVKPLYYLWDDKKLAFASEAKAILEVFSEEIIPNNKAIYRLLRSTPEDRDETTYYKNIKSLKKATYVEIDLQDFKWSQYDYWHVDTTKFREKWIDGKNVYKTCKELLENAVRIRLRADVDVGSCLSGGLDSSIIVGICNKREHAKMHTFSSVYKDKECNEKEFIDAVNKFNNTIPHIIYPEPSGKDIIECFKKIIKYHDGPNSGASLYSQYSVMEGASSVVKVLLDGQGADELFGGYIPYYYYYISDLLRKNTPISTVKAVNTLAIIDTEWRKMASSIGMDDIILYLGEYFYKHIKKKWDSKGTIDNKPDPPMFTEEFLKKTDTSINYEKYPVDGVLNTVLCKEILRDGIPHLVHNEDGNSMAFSVETRLPFLDYRLVEFALALDAKHKIKGEWTKYILRRCCKQYLPSSVCRRKNKMGFPAPFSRWLREGEQKERFRELIYSFADRNIVPRETIDYYYQTHMNEKQDNNAILYKFLVIELWLRDCDDKRVKRV